MKEAHVHYELSYEHVLHRNYTTLASIIRPTLLTQLRKAILSRSTFNFLFLANFSNRVLTIRCPFEQVYSSLLPRLCILVLPDTSKPSECVVLSLSPRCTS